MVEVLFDHTRVWSVQPVPRPSEVLGVVRHGVFLVKDQYAGRARDGMAQDRGPRRDGQPHGEAEHEAFAHAGIARHRDQQPLGQNLVNQIRWARVVRRGQDRFDIGVGIHRVHNHNTVNEGVSTVPLDRSLPKGFSWITSPECSTNTEISVRFA